MILFNGIHEENPNMARPKKDSGKENKEENNVIKTCECGCKRFFVRIGEITCVRCNKTKII